MRRRRVDLPALVSTASRSTRATVCQASPDVTANNVSIFLNIATSRTVNVLSSSTLKERFHAAAFVIRSGALKMREWKMQKWKLQEKTAEVEIAGVEKAGVDRTGGKCRSGKYGSENVWKTVRTENKNLHQLIITDSTHPISKERLKLELSNLVHREAISSLIKQIKNPVAVL